METPRVPGPLTRHDEGPGTEGSTPKTTWNGLTTKKKVDTEGDVKEEERGTSHESNVEFSLVRDNFEK